MKLKLKISLVFGGVVFAALMIVGWIYGNINFKSVESRVYQGMETASELAGKQLSEQLDLYCNIITVTGKDTLLMSDASNEQMYKRMDELAETYGFTSGNVLGLDGKSLKDGTDFSDRAYVEEALKGNINISDITLSKLTGKYGFSVAGPLYDESGSIKGVVYFRMDVDFMHAILDRIEPSENGYAYLVNKEGLVIVHPDDELIGEYNIAEENKDLKLVMDELDKGESGIKEYTHDNEKIEVCYLPVEGTDGWGLLVAVPRNDYRKDIVDTLVKLTVIDIVVWLITVIVSIVFAENISKTTNRVVEVMTKLSKGDFSEKLKPTNKKDELSVLLDTTCSLRDTFVGIVKDEKRVLGAITEFDLTEPDIEGYQGEFKVLADSVNQIKRMLEEIIKKFQIAASEVSAGSREIAKATESLSFGATSQSDSIEMMMTNIEDIVDKISKSAENEATVKEKLHNLEVLIQNGNNEMASLFEIVREIEMMSNDIQNIIKLIDSIAFQTNILALNASVEAARAGESGKGFSVVADEIGSLAEKAGNASKQTAELIEQCLKGIKKANDSATTTSDCLNEIVVNSEEINCAFEEIAEDTRHQAEKSTSIKEAIRNVSDVVATNTAATEETAAATEELSGQSESMSRMIMKFKTK